MSRLTQWRVGVMAFAVLLIAGIVPSAADIAEEQMPSEETAPTDVGAEASVSTPPEAAPTDVGAEAVAPAVEQAPSDQTAASAPPAAAPTDVGAQAGLISVDFKDADIRQVLRIISLKSGVDIVAGPDVEGLVTIKLTNVPWEQALDVILRTYSLAYERKGNIVRVLTAAAVEQETLATEIYPLSYGKAKEVSEMLKEMLTDRGKIKFDERTNTVVVIDLPSNLFQVGQVIKRLDQPTAQVRIESRIIETTLAKNEHIGIDWNDKIEVTATTATAATTFPFPGGGNLGNLGTTFIPRVAGTDEARIPEVGGTFTFGTIKANNFVLTLNAISNRTDTNIISNPSITTLNNREALVQVGEDINIPNFQIDPSTGKATVSGFQTRSTGILLKVTPHVNQEREIVLDLKPEITETAAKFDEFASGISFPRFTVQKADTQVRLNNGETLVIGGLVKRKKTVSHAKVPFLGDIPLLGRLFSDHNVDEPTHQDLLIFITVNLVEDEAKPEQALAAQPGE